jgi:hypothetical protein
MTEAVRRTLTNRERRRLSDWRRKKGIVRRTVTLTQNDLDALEVRGCLDPIHRGNPQEEADAIQKYIDDDLCSVL